MQRIIRTEFASFGLDDAVQSGWPDNLRSAAITGRFGGPNYVDAYLFMGADLECEVNFPYTYGGLIFTEKSLILGRKNLLKNSL